LIQSGESYACIYPIQDFEAHIPYLQEKKINLKYIFETQDHNDFHPSISTFNKTFDSKAIFGPVEDPKDCQISTEDGQTFEMEAVVFEIMHTPGISPESCCVILKEKSGEPKYIFTGDTLLIGDVGKPDLGSHNTAKEKEDACL
jgi:hydroxyacylglutathione hydrolase